MVGIHFPCLPQTLNNKIINLEPFKEKFESFGWNTKIVDGHNIKSIIDSIKELFLCKSKPNVLIANTVKGKSINFMENKFESHYEVLNANQYQAIIKKLK